MKQVITNTGNIKSATLVFKNEPVQPKQKPKVKEKPVKKVVEKQYKREKFVTLCTVSDEDREKLKRIFALVNHARQLTQSRLNRSVDESIEELESNILKSINPRKSGKVSDTLRDLILRDIRRIYKAYKETGKAELGNTKSLAFKEDRFVNNFFTINYRRNKIFFEDINITVNLRDSLPRVIKGSEFYINIFVEDLVTLNKVLVNFFHEPVIN